MAYKYTKGTTSQGDIVAQVDPERNTEIDFEDDYIGLKTGGQTNFVVSGSNVGIGTATPDYTLDVAGPMGVSDYIYHNGDSNTYIRFQDDDININCGGKSMIKMSEQPSSQDIVTINNSTSNVDFRVKGDDDNNLLRCDASSDRVGIGTSVPTVKLDINSASLRLRETKTPTSRTDSGNVGTICWDANYIYVCVADNEWKRAALTDSGW